MSTQAVLAQRPTVGLPRAASFLAIDDWTEDSGLRVRVCDSGPPGLACAKIVLHRGSGPEAAAKAGVTNMAIALADEGGSGLDRVGVAKYFEAIATGFGYGVSPYETTITVSGLAESLPEAVARAAAIFADPYLPESSFTLQRARAMQGVAIGASRPESMAQAGFVTSVFRSGTPWARPAGGTAASLSSLTHADIVEAHSAVMGAPATFVLAGDVASLDIAAAVEGATTALAPFGSHPATAPTPDPEIRPVRILVVDRPGSPQSVIRAGAAARHPYGDPVLDAALGVVGVVITGETSRLNNLLREQRGITYGVSGGLSQGRNLVSLQIATSVEQGATATAVSDILAVVRSIATGDITSDEVDAHRERVLGSRVLGLQSTTAVAGAMANLVRYGLPSDWQVRSRQALIDLTVDQVNDAARAHVDAESIQVVVVGDAASITNGLAEAGVPVEDLDVSGYFTGSA